MNNSINGLSESPFSGTVEGAPSTPDDFLIWASTLGPEYEGCKVELSNGVVTRMMINVRRSHVRVCSNILRLLMAHLDRRDYLVSSGDFSVKVPGGVRCPDILVEPANQDPDALASSNPVFIAEVLSPSTTAVDFLEKLPEYTAIQSVYAYLICSAEEPIVWLMARGKDGHWPDLPERIAGMDSVIALLHLGLHLPMAEIYFDAPAAGGKADA
jgi:Uma2 family endonuclease